MLVHGRGATFQQKNCLHVLLKLLEFTRDIIMYSTLAKSLVAIMTLHGCYEVYVAVPGRLPWTPCNSHVHPIIAT